MLSVIVVVAHDHHLDGKEGIEGRMIFQLNFKFIGMT
jgi:hypothetical protein